jgi:hypothetical protein
LNEKMEKHNVATDESVFLKLGLLLHDKTVSLACVPNIYVTLKLPYSMSILVSCLGSFSDNCTFRWSSLLYVLYLQYCDLQHVRTTGELCLNWRVF